MKCNLLTAITINAATINSSSVGNATYIYIY